ncbi:MAG: N-6 DNA methylase [Pseudomonadota bacterium]
MSQNQNIVQKIWGLCHILRGDGISYHQYVSELTYLLFLKIAEENGSEALLPKGYHWKNLAKASDDGLLNFYQEMLTYLGHHAGTEAVRAIFAFPTTVFSHDENLRAVIDGITKIDWNDRADDSFGQIYEGLLQKSADVRSGAGQYFTPRALVESIVQIIQPHLGDLIQDPATGSGGFLVAADRFIRSNNTQKSYSQKPPRYQGAEIEKNTRRICLMNTLLHGLNADIVFGDALTDDASSFEPADIILANPPFGAKSGSKRTLRNDIAYPSANKQLAFLQHIYLNLKVGGRAAVVLPDNVLFEDGVGKQIRQDLMAMCDLHTILRLPTGIFTSAGVKTNVMFFTKISDETTNATKAVWFYDMRAQMPNYGKTRTLMADDFANFIKAYGDDPLGKAKRKDEGEAGRFRMFTREEIAKRNDNLDISWLREEEIEDNLNEPDDIAAAILSHLRNALEEIEAVADELAETEEVEA